MTHASKAHAVSDLPTFGEFLESTRPTVVMRDPQLKKSDRHARAQLRTIPLFKAFGIETVIHTSLYDNNFKLVEYDCLSSTDAIDEVDELEFPLVHIVTQEGISEYGEEDLVRELLRRSNDEDGRYVLVTDSLSPRTPSYTKKPGKSVVAEFDVTTKDYEDLFTRFLDEYLNSALPAAKTRNLFYHQVSTHHRQAGAPANELEELFDYSNAPVDSPVWDPLYFFIEHDLENILEDYSEHIQSSLRSWTEWGDTRRIANGMLDALRVNDYEKEQLESYQKTAPNLR